MSYRLFFVLLFVPMAALGDLTAVVTPGYQFPTDGSVTPTYQLLNLLATPTVSIFGTVGGSNIIAPGSLTTVSFSAGVIDDTTIKLTGATPGAMYVYAPGIAGTNGITSASSNSLSLLLDPNYFLLQTNSFANTNDNTGSVGTNWLTLNVPGLVNTNSTPRDTTNGPTALLSFNAQAQLTYNSFTSAPAPMLPQSGQVTNVTVPFGHTPSLVRWVVVALTNTASYTTNDELPISDFFVGDHTSQAMLTPMFAAYARDTNLVLTQISPLATTVVGNFYVLNTNGTLNSVGTNAWALKVYAWP